LLLLLLELQCCLFLRRKLRLGICLLSCGHRCVRGRLCLSHACQAKRQKKYSGPEIRMGAGHACPCCSNSPIARFSPCLISATADAQLPGVRRHDKVSAEKPWKRAIESLRTGKVQSSVPILSRNAEYKFTRINAPLPDHKVAKACPGSIKRKGRSTC
jgi:hypothetical protein